MVFGIVILVRPCREESSRIDVSDQLPQRSHARGTRPRPSPSAGAPSVDLLAVQSRDVARFDRSPVR